MTMAIPVKHAVRSRPRRTRPRRDPKALEQRRMQAADLFRRGVSPAEIARRLGVSHQIVSEWRKAWRRGGRGAEANGYATDVWTLSRVAEVILRLTDVSYHPGHVWYLLRNQLDWTWQRPARRAVERNEEAIEQWVEKRWPQLKKGLGAGTR